MSATDRPTARFEPVLSAEDIAQPAARLSPVCPARVCIVTLRINGSSRNSGIGTASTVLAELQQKVHEVGGFRLCEPGWDH